MEDKFFNPNWKTIPIIVNDNNLECLWQILRNLELFYKPK